MNDKLLEAVKKLGMAQTLSELRDYAHARSDEASRDGFSGGAWYDVSRDIDNIVPILTDEQMDFEPEGGY